MKNKKSIAVTMGAVVLTAVVTLGGTLAYLQSVTETKTNTFTSSKNIVTELTETQWLEDSGKDYTPGKIIYKNPVMINQSEDQDQGIYVAVKLDYIDSQGEMTDYEAFKKYAQVYTGAETNLDVYHTNWNKLRTNADGSEIWVYHTAVGAGQSTESIFDGVKVFTGITEEWTQQSKTTATYRVDETGNKTLVNTSTETYDPTVSYVDADGNPVAAGALPTFEIKVTGYAVQEDGLSFSQAQEELVKLVNSKTAEKF